MTKINKTYIRNEFGSVELRNLGFGEGRRGVERRRIRDDVDIIKQSEIQISIRIITFNKLGFDIY